MKVDSAFFIEDTTTLEKLVSDYCAFYDTHQRQPGIFGEERRLGYWRLNVCSLYRSILMGKYPNEEQRARILAVDHNFFIL